MPYRSDDPRSALAAVAPTAEPSAFAGADYVRFEQVHNAEQAPGRQEWLARAQHIVVGYSVVDGGSEFELEEAEEHIVILTDPGLSADATVDAETVSGIPGERLVVLPPGRSRVRVRGTGVVIRVVRSTSALADRASNAASYRYPHPNVAEFVAWPPPVGGFRIRVYDVTVPTVDGSPMRIFRTTNMMINYCEPQHGARDPRKLSPHHHDDFEQLSLAIEGVWVHHLRWPWTTDRTIWREDEHVVCPAPSLAVIPPPSIHTSEATAPGRNRLVDIFSPPRFDFSAMPGWVVNAEDYAVPGAAE